MVLYPDAIEYSEPYNDDFYQYRHVILPRAVALDLYRMNRGKRLLEESEWRGLGVTQSRGWEHYMIHKPEPHIMMFRRPLETDPATGKAPVTVFFVHVAPAGEGVVDVSCTNMAGDEVISESVLVDETVSTFADRVSTLVQLAPERLQLMLPSGEEIPLRSEQTVSSFALSDADHTRNDADRSQDADFGFSRE